MDARHTSPADEQRMSPTDTSPAKLSWDMRDWTDDDVVVDAVVMALKGCGDDETPVVLRTETGQKLTLVGIDAGADGRVHLIVGPAATVASQPGQVEGSGR
ncbi:hypothetical protein GCM10010156_66130 [Planobispora rosea]|uniref:Uncharacterized protein n=1 Tax=Planobispora rosea TaxID=35762 RepID=A0A8J3WGQ7_PLARO|nr:hypothetical protein [Planobispora rosea]GGS98788.1 hypothetical protein GCM10010156_66130 [Planobispora rosea]GIH87977.1 hypothetical protein Pro02_63850 [Planobispora rosea]